MELKELDKLIIEEQKRSKEAIRKLKSDYAKVNRKYSIGAILKSRDSIIIVERFSVSGSYYTNECYIRYIGTKLRKSDLKPYKSEEKDGIDQPNVIEAIKKEEK